MKRRPLYLQLYLALLVSILVALGAVAVAFRMLREGPGHDLDNLRRAGEMLESARPDLRAPDARERLDAIANELDVDVAIGDVSGLTLASSSRRPFVPPRRPQDPGWRHGPQGPALVVALEGDLWGAVRPRHAGPPPHRLHPFFVMLIALAVVMAAASYPIARRVTRRLESLTAAVERWGQGELHHRIPKEEEEGRDEVATLAATFNRAAERLDALLSQQKQMLANASHELRSPLARLRMAVELIAEEPEVNKRQGRIEEVRRDIVELDNLIEEILLYARADLRVPPRPPESVDLGALVADETTRAQATVDITGGATVEGDALLLRHLVRNLIENAQRHGRGRNVRASLVQRDHAVLLSVEDDGPGVPEPDRERIFAPFYRLPGAAPNISGRDGFGVGLALVRQVARYHGGDARCLASASGGSRFEVTLSSRLSRSAPITSTREADTNARSQR